METTEISVKSILTRTSGYLRTVTSHSIQPYRGCALGSSLCGVGCYVRHSAWLTRGRVWGSFVDVKTNAAEAYREEYERERYWARKAVGRMGVFLSSATEPFQPMERKAHVTRSLLEVMEQLPPDELVIQTHSPMVCDYLDLYPSLAAKTDLRFHISIETDREEGLPGLARHASSIAKRIEASGRMRAAGLRVVITVSPLLPIREPRRFFARLAEVADAVVIDHFIGGDGSADGGRTKRTGLPLAMRGVEEGSVSLEYRGEIVELAEKYFPGRVGVGIDGFAGRMHKAI